LLLFSPAPVLAQGWQLVWTDDFDGTSVDTTKWEFMEGDGCAFGICFWGNNERQWYSSENTAVADGHLIITAKQESVGGLDYTSSRLRTLARGDWKYGRIEVSARLPVGQGIWPAIWMLPTDTDYGVWPASGEIDIVEVFGQRPDEALGSIHFGEPHTFTTRVRKLDSGSYADDFHTFAVHRLENRA